MGDVDDDDVQAATEQGPDESLANVRVRLLPASERARTDAFVRLLDSRRL
jgi:hypothetical protein